MADGPILPLPQHHQADDYNGSYGNGNHQQTNEGAAAETEVIPKGIVIILEGRKQRSRWRKSAAGDAHLEGGHSKVFSHL